MNIIFVFPNSLFENNELINSNSTVYIIEHDVYFTMYNYHKLKLILHRASMKYYEDYIKKKYKCKVKYIEFDFKLNKIFAKHKNKTITFYDPVDHDVMNDIKSLSRKHHVKLNIKDTPLFLTNVNDLKQYYDSLKSDKISHSNFYKWQRIHHGILINKNNKPIGKSNDNKWTYDTKNRLPFPKNFKNNYNPRKINNSYIKEATTYVNKYFKDNPGNTDMYLPINHDGAKNHFKQFVKNRLKCFGPYQDAVDKNIPFGCHSILSPLMNIGLITPSYVIKTVTKYVGKIPIESLEGYIRQIIGWREYCRLMYLFKYNELKHKNHFNHTRKIDEDIWYYGNFNNGGTGIDVINDLIQKTINIGYLHHIERLMYIGNFTLINKIKPIDVFKWFQSMNIDSYHVFMYPNVYGMSQYSSGPIMMTRPYFSSASYIAKMSNYTIHKNKYSKITIDNEEYEWLDIWNALYYNFISENITEFKKNYAIAQQVKHWQSKTKAEQSKIKILAHKYMLKY